MKNNFNKKPKTKYKLNVHKGGTIFANNLLQLVYKVIFKKYVPTNNRRGGRSGKANHIT